MSWLFVVVQKYLQISIFSLRDDRSCSLVFTWVGVKLVSTGVYSVHTFKAEEETRPDLLIRSPSRVSMYSYGGYQGAPTGKWIGTVAKPVWSPLVASPIQGVPDRGYWY